MSSDQSLIDFAILPQQQLQNYEKTIDEQKEAIDKLKAEIQSLTNSKNDNSEPVSSEDVKNPNDDADTEGVEAEAEEDQKSPPPPPIKVEKDSDPEISQPSELVKETKKIDIGKNFNKKCLAQQLKHKLSDTSYVQPSNIDALVAAAVSSAAKKPIANEKEFYEAIKSNHLISLIKCKSKFDQYIRPSFFKI